MHGRLYKKEYNYGIGFETYVAEGLVEFYQQHDSSKDRVWICEYKNKMVGFLLSMHRGDAAQLRYFILKPAFRGIGLGNKLMNLYVEHIKQCNYKTSYLWTTDELRASARQKIVCHKRLILITIFFSQEYLQFCNCSKLPVYNY
jgi:peptidyl-dipeptidase Dcp